MIEIIELTECIEPPDSWDAVLSTKKAKKKDFYVSRYSLFNGLKKVIPDLSNEVWRPAVLKKLEITNHHHLSYFPDIKVSLSHTKGSGLSYLSNDPNIQSIGIDFEKADRLYKDEWISKIGNQDEVSLLGSNLKLWIAKEAIFKAISSLISETPIFSFHLIKIKNAESFECKTHQKKFLGTLQFQTNRHFLISLAKITTSSPFLDQAL